MSKVKSFTPYSKYVFKKCIEWRVDFPNRRTERGDVEYVASEFCNDGLYYPFNCNDSGEHDIPWHEHSFHRVVENALEYPDTFSIDGFEEYYSEQERTFLINIRNKYASIREG